MTPATRDSIQHLSKTLACTNCLGEHAGYVERCPTQAEIIQLLESLVEILFPGYQVEGRPFDAEQNVAEELSRLAEQMCTYLGWTFAYFDCKKDNDDCSECYARAERITEAFWAQFGEIRRILHEDILAAYDGDPAARNTQEITMAYPGIYAVAVHRIAHLLYAQGVPLLPRVMSEAAHSKTGIDIHPGAQIGSGFFIDHGTGVVIGETCVIGQRVKLYQGVTLGALSFEKDAEGHLIKGIKRHPNVEDNVVIYAGATILGGTTTIGANSVIGGNVWLIHSVPPCTIVYNDQPTPKTKPITSAPCCN